MIELLSVGSNVMSSTNCDISTSLSRGERMFGLFRILIVMVSVVKTYKGMESGQPCLNPLSSLIKDVSHPFVSTELETEL